MNQCCARCAICVHFRILHPGAVPPRAHELLFPWFAVRKGIRCNNHKALDWSWSYFLPLFRATNKNQYAAYAVQQAATVHMMCSDVRKVWNEHRTASMSGRPGRNVAWDYVLEKMNLAFKQYLHDHITEERLHDFGIMINSIKHNRKPFERAWRHGAGDPDDEEDHGEYSHVKDAVVKAIADAPKDHLEGTVQEIDDKDAAFALAGKQNPFAEKKNKVLPWTKIEAKGMKKLLDHCLAHSNLPPQVWSRA